MAFDPRSLFLTSPQRQIQLIQILAKKRKEEIYRNQVLEHRTRQEFAAKQEYLHLVNLEHDQKRLEASIWSIDNSVCYLKPDVPNSESSNSSKTTQTDLFTVWTEANKRKMMNTPIRELIEQLMKIDPKQVPNSPDISDLESSDDSLSGIHPLGDSLSSGYSSPSVVVQSSLDSNSPSRKLSGSSDGSSSKSPGSSGQSSVGSSSGSSSTSSGASSEKSIEELSEEILADKRFKHRLQFLGEEDKVLQKELQVIDELHRVEVKRLETIRKQEEQIRRDAERQRIEVRRLEAIRKQNDQIRRETKCQSFGPVEIRELEAQRRETERQHKYREAERQRVEIQKMEDQRKQDELFRRGPSQQQTAPPCPPPFHQNLRKIRFGSGRLPQNPIR